MPAEIGVFTPNGRPYCCARPSAAKTLVIPNGLIVRNLLLRFWLAALPPSLPGDFPLWKSSGNSVGSDD